MEDFIEEDSPEVKAILRERHTELLTLIEALGKLEESKEWNVVKELVFDKSLKSIERQLLNESLAKEVKKEKIYRLQGEWAWAKQFCDTKRFIETLKAQLSDLKKRI
jgi:hypothetical protein